MKIKTAEASNKQLDWGVAVVLGLEPELAHHECYRDGVVVLAHRFLKVFSREYKQGFSHTDPAVCMGLIEQYSLAFSECDTRHLYDKPDTLWRVVCRKGSGYGESKVLAQAVARCVISMKLGDEFECPSELLGEVKMSLMAIHEANARMHKEIKAYKSEIDALKAQRDELLAALQVIVDAGGIGSDDMFDDARDAIEKVQS